MDGNYEKYKRICLRLKDICRDNHDHPDIIEAIKKAQAAKSLLDKLNPSYRARLEREVH